MTVLDVVQELFIPHRDVPKDWQKALDRIAPQGQRTTWLKLVWLAGNFYEPVNRWAIYEMVPPDSPMRAHIPDFLLLGLEGEDPRKWGAWEDDASVPGGRRWRSHSTVSRVQWDLYHTTRCVPLLFWIIQGSHGGHHYRLPAAEAHYLSVVHGDGWEHPGPGDLPYADFDQRVVEKILASDRLRKWEKAQSQPFEQRIETPSRAGLLLMKEDHEQETYYADRMLADLDGCIEELVRALPQADIDRAMAHAQIAPEGYMRDDDVVRQQLTEHTSHAPFDYGCKE